MARTGLFRAVEILEGMATAAREKAAALAIAPARMEAYRANRAGEDADCREADALGMAVKTLEKAISALDVAAHEDPTTPNTTLLEMKLGRD